MAKKKPKPKPQPPAAGEIRDRIKELRRVPAAELQANPRNWRTHPEHQKAALSAVLQEVGYAGALIARELADGTLELIDGHLRAETTPDSLVPVLVLDVNEAEAAKLLATLDPLAALAEADTAKLDALLRDVQTSDQSLAQMLTNLAEEHDLVDLAEESEDEPPEGDQVVIGDRFQIIVDCDSEQHQQDLYEQFAKEGLTCRVLTL